MQIAARPSGEYDIRLKDFGIRVGRELTIGDFSISGPGEYEIGGVMAEASPTAIRFYADECVCAYLRPRAEKLSDEELEQLGAVDVLFFPLGADGLPVKDAVALLAQIEAPIMIPYASAPAEVEAFCKEQANCERQAGPLKLSRSQLPTEGSRVIVFEAAADHA